MLTPGDKVFNRGNDIIQILVTRACNLFSCSNCTQLLPFRKDTLHMGVDVFRAAVRSMAGWPGVVAMFGGNPCSHPKFEDLAAILEEEIPEQHRRGLWSNAFLGHGETVRRVFYPHARFNLNAHADREAAVDMARWCPGKVIEASVGSPAWHGPILMDREDLGISAEDWVPIRESCDINRNWSGIVVERDGFPYGYFCEVAAAIDGVRGENHGMLASPGWWREPIANFAGQISGCCDRGCGVPFRFRGHLDRDDVYDVTRAWVPMTSPRKGRVSIHEHSEGLEKIPRSGELTDYLRLRTPAERGR